MQKISGPLLDRIDIRSYVEVPSRVELSAIEPGESSADVRARVIQGREVAAERFKADSWKLNSRIPASQLRHKYRARREAMAFLHA